MLYLKNDTELQEVKIFASVPRGTYTEPINPDTPEGGGVTEYQVQEIIDENLENYYDKQEIDNKFENYYDKTEVDELISNIETGGGGDTPTGGDSGKIFTFRYDGHAYCDYVMEIVDRCIEGKLSTIKFGIDSNIQGTATILNFSKTYKSDFDMIGEEGWQYYLTILYQNKEQTETKTYWYYVGDYSNGMTGTGIWYGTYDNKLGYIIAPEIKPFGGGDTRVIKVNDDKSIKVEDLNFAIDSIVNGGNAVFQFSDGSMSSFYYEVAKYDTYAENGMWVSLRRQITLINTLGFSTLNNAIYIHYNYDWYGSENYTNASYDEDGNMIIYSMKNGILIEEGGTDYYPVFHDVRITDELYLHDTATLENYGTLQQHAYSTFNSPVEMNSDVTINGRATFHNEPTFSATGSENYEDISSGILCDFKCQKAQVTNLYNRNIYMGLNENAINFINGRDNKILAKIDNIGNLYEGETRLDDKYVLKTKYEALENKVLNLESSIEQIKQQLGIE